MRDVEGARVLALLGDSVTTDHISPAGDIALDSLRRAATWSSTASPKQDFNSYGSRRGNDRVMVRGTFANIRLKNLLVPGVEGGVTVHVPSGERMDDLRRGRALQGRGHAARGDRGQGVRQRQLARLGRQGHAAARRARGDRARATSASTARTWSGWACCRCSSSRAQSAESLGLSGRETLTIRGLAGELKPRQDVTVEVERADGSRASFVATARLDTPVEVNYYRNGGILQTVLRKLVA